MSCKRVYLFAIASFLLFSIVKGSCLEYGHSCWGAHGKRSSGNAGKLLRAAPNIRNTEGDGNPAVQANKDLLESIDEMNNPPDRNGIIRLSADDTGDTNSLNFRDLPSLKNLFRKHNIKLRNRNALTDDSFEQEEALKERWHKIPVFKLRPLTKPQMVNSENDLLQQPSKGVAIDESLYYDFQ